MGIRSAGEDGFPSEAGGIGEPRDKRNRFCLNSAAGSALSNVSTLAGSQCLHRPIDGSAWMVTFRSIPFPSRSTCTVTTSPG